MTERPDNSRLTAAVGSDESDQFSGVDPKTDVIQYYVAFVAELYVLHF
jgi:hypothetical protein